MSWNRAEIYRKAEHYRAKRRYKRAVKEYLKIVELDPDDVQVQWRLADCYRLMKKSAEAVAYYDRVAEALFQQKRPDKAISIYKQLVALDRRNLKRYEDCGRAYIMMDKKADAVRLYTDGLSNFRSRKLRAQSIILHEWILELEPGTARVRLVLAKMLTKNGEKDAAFQILHQGLQYLVGKNRRYRRSYRWKLFRLKPSFRRFWQFLTLRS